jgi:hypothetical protein
VPLIAGHEPARGGWLSLEPDGESKLSEHRDGTGLSALEIAGAQALARGELISRAQDGFRRITALVLDQFISRGRAETMLREEFPCIARTTSVLVTRSHATMCSSSQDGYGLLFRPCV